MKRRPQIRQSVLTAAVESDLVDNLQNGVAHHAAPIVGVRAYHGAGDPIEVLEVWRQSRLLLVGRHRLLGQKLLARSRRVVLLPARDARVVQLAVDVGDHAHSGVLHGLDCVGAAGASREVVRIMRVEAAGRADRRLALSVCV